MDMLQYIGLAFLGGVILNIMPCVLPVLTLKVFHTIDASGDPDHDPRKHGIAYAGGTVFAFSIFAILIIGLRASGQTMGWGMHFQHPPFVAALTAIIFAFGLNALGVFELNVSLSGTQEKSGVAASFGNGIFAAVMSTPCTAPFLATAAGFALAADTSWWQTMILFGAIGLGLAFPYTLVGFVPAIAKFLPKPGTWMVTFKQLMGFTLLATSVWLFGALQAQVTPSAANYFLFFLLVLAVGLWAMDRFAPLHYSRLRRLSVRAVVFLVVVGAGYSIVDLEKQAQAAPVVADGERAPPVVDGKINWTMFAEDVVVQAHAIKRPVFMDYTADWCAACKTNEKVFLETDTVRSALVETNILPVKADMTNDQPVLDAWLDRLGRSGIPAYVIYLPDGEHDLLPTTITAGMVAKRLRAAAEAFPPQAFNSTN